MNTRLEGSNLQEEEEERILIVEKKKVVIIFNITIYTISCPCIWEFTNKLVTLLFLLTVIN